MFFVKIGKGPEKFCKICEKNVNTSRILVFDEKKIVCNICAKIID